MSDQTAADRPPVGLAFVGLGWWGNELATAFTRSGGGRVAACFARNEDSRAAFVAAHGGTSAPSFEALLEDDDVDGLVLATPHSTHRPMIEAAAAAGKHVFVEKPLTVSTEDAHAAVAAADRAGVVLQVGHHRRRVAATRALRQRVDEGWFGTLMLLEARMLTPSELDPRGGWRGDPEECPLGGMTALGVHMVDNIHYLAGPVAEVHATSRPILGRSALDDITTLALDLESGALATLSTSSVLPRAATISVSGHEGAAWSEVDGAELYEQPIDARSRTQVPIEPIDALADELSEFATCIREGTRPEVGGAEGAAVVEVLEAARLSQQRHAPVAVADVREGRARYRP